jgi:hypothetical protein
MCLGRYCGLNLACPLFGCTDLICGRKSSDSFLAGWPKILFSIFWRPATIRIDVVNKLGVVALAAVIVTHWS